MSDVLSQREEVARIGEEAGSELAAVWSAALVGLPFDDVREALQDVLPALSSNWGDLAASLAAEFYDEARRRARVGGEFEPVLADGPSQVRWESLSVWGTEPLFRSAETGLLVPGESVELDPDWDASLKRLQGGLQRSIADQHRQTIMQSAVTDSRAQGWRRVGVGSNCDFCRRLINGGTVYRKTSAGFSSHDHCNCVAEMVWK